MVCNYCEKVIEGYTPEHTEFLMLQHKLKHRKEEKQDGSKKKEKI